MTRCTNALTCEERGLQHLRQDVLLDDDLVNWGVWTPFLRLVPLVGGGHDQRLAVCGLHPKDDAPEEVTLWTSLACLVVIREVDLHLDIRQDAGHQLCHCQLWPLRNLE